MASYNIGTRIETKIRLAKMQATGRYAFISLIEAIIKGSPGSGNWTHTSITRRGKVGGSDPGGGLSAMGVETGSEKVFREVASAALRATRMDPVIVKRVRFKGDQPATEKQTNFASSLLEKAKSKAVTDDSPVVQRFFERAELPANLTKWEASGLITRFKNDSPKSLVQATADAIIGREQGVKVNDTQTIYALLALQPAVGFLANYLKLRP